MIRILNDEFEIIDTIVKYTSFQWIRRYSDTGSFSFVIPVAEATPSIKKDAYIFNNGYYGIIEYIKQNNDLLTVNGYDLKGLMHFRYCQGNKSGNAETIIKQYVNENTTGNRKFDRFNVNVSQSRGEDVSHVIENLSLLDVEIKKICDSQKWGYKIDVIDKQLYFDVCVPEEKNNVTFSRRMNNINSYEYCLDALNEVNNIVNLDSTGTATNYGNNALTGKYRKEAVNQQDGTSAELEAAISALLVEGAEKETISAEAFDLEGYKKEWNLGDFVNISVDVLGERITFKKQITEIQEIYEAGNVRVVPTFGTAKESIIRKLIKERKF